MNCKEARKILFNYLKEEGFEKVNANEMKKKYNDNFVIVYFQKSSYDEDFYISIGLYVPEANSYDICNITYENSDFHEPQIIGLIECEKIEKENLKNIFTSISKKINSDFLNISLLAKKAKKGYFNKYSYKAKPDFIEYLKNLDISENKESIFKKAFKK
ncbi:hypothetical protein OKW22_000928 [Bacilli bacterium PM5-3]|nr:hypothetical protein [Bacilli bacterium PM5-3]MDH6603290.1 hypothetical protein [Bacilli bacterium PM5-9]